MGFGGSDEKTALSMPGCARENHLSVRPESFENKIPQLRDQIRPLLIHNEKIRYSPDPCEESSYGLIAQRGVGIGYTLTFHPANGVTKEFGSGVNAEFGLDVIPMHRHGFRAKIQCTRRLFCAFPFAKQAEHVEFPIGEFFDERFAASGFGAREKTDNLASQA